MKNIGFLLIGLLIIPVMVHAQENNQGFEKATFAGGCFWCMESPFEKLEGVHTVISGYTGGEKEGPTYEEVLAGSTGHAEAVEITYDPNKVSYGKLLNTFWRNIDPTQKNGQFADHGSQYRTAIFYHNEKQKQLAEKSKQDLEDSKKFDKPIVTEIVPSQTFFLAEEYHQDYYKKQPEHYKKYHYLSGRASFIEKIWGKD